jgi:hypothetical protein
MRVEAPPARTIAAITPIPSQHNELPGWMAGAGKRRLMVVRILDFPLLTCLLLPPVQNPASPAVAMFDGLIS